MVCSSVNRTLGASAVTGNSIIVISLSVMEKRSELWSPDGERAT